MNFVGIVVGEWLRGGREPEGATGVTWYARPGYSVPLGAAIEANGRSRRHRFVRRRSGHPESLPSPAEWSRVSPEFDRTVDGSPCRRHRLGGAPANDPEVGRSLAERCPDRTSVDRKSSTILGTSNDWCILRSRLGRRRRTHLSSKIDCTVSGTTRRSRKTTYRNTSRPPATTRSTLDGSVRPGGKTVSPLRSRPGTKRISGRSSDAPETAIGWPDHH
jgi:hypothetical protein